MKETSTDPDRDGSGDPGYPHQWEADVVLADGATAQLRPIRPQDADALQRFHAGQSPRSIYMRFFTAMPVLPPQTLHKFTHVDQCDRVALVATIGDEIVGVGRYDVAGPGAAEVAFTISDAHHERGLSSVLLEHLAAAARENGIEEFLAEVLPENRAMIGVLRDAGYELKGGLEDGMVSLSFRIDPTARSLAVMEAREHRSESRSLRGLLRPSSVAVVVGDGERDRALGERVLRNLVRSGFTGGIAVVSHERPESLVPQGQSPELPTYRSLADVPGAVELVVAAMTAEDVVRLVEACAAKAVRGVLVISGGFAEEGTAERAKVQRRLLEAARKHGIRLVGPNSWGLIDSGESVRLNASLLEQAPVPGHLGLFTQSDVGSALAWTALAERGVGVSSFVSAGNRVDVSGNDCLQYWEQDEDTRVIGLFLESIGNPRKFSRIARRLNRHKPVIVLTSGQVGVGAPPGQPIRKTNAPAGAFDALLAQSGCICVDTVGQLLDVAEFVLSQPIPKGPRVAIVSNSYTLQASVAQVCQRWGLDEPKRLPVLPAGFGPGFLRAAVEDAAGDVDAVLTALIPPLPGPAADLLRALDEADCDVPLLACVLGGGAGPAERTTSARPDDVVPSYPSPEQATRALALATRYRAWRDPVATLPQGAALLGPRGEVRSAAKALVAQELAAHRKGAVLEDDAVARLLGCYGVAVAPDGGVSEHGVACVVRTMEDPLIGPIVSFGIAGDASDLLGDVAHRIPPLTQADVVDLVSSVRAAPKLFGHGGADPVDVVALHDLLGRISCLAEDLPEVAELVLDPVVVFREGLAVLGARIRVALDPRRGDAGVRQLTRP